MFANITHFTVISEVRVSRPTHAWGDGDKNRLYLSQDITVNTQQCSGHGSPQKTFK